MRPTILIAEDDAELCGFFQRFLTKRGYQVETAGDGLDCLQKARALRPDVLVLDLELRWGGGDGVLARLREERALATVAVILTTSASAPRHITEDIEPPVVTFLPKPFALMALLDSVRDALARKSQEPLPVNRAPCPELFFG